MMVLVVILLVGVGALAATIGDYGEPQLGSANASEDETLCTLSQESDCSIGGFVGPKGGGTVDENLTIDIYFGPNPAGNLSLSPDNEAGRRIVQHEQGVVETVRLSEGSVRYTTDSVPGYRKYAVLPIVNRSGWGVRLANRSLERFTCFVAGEPRPAIDPTNDRCSDTYLTFDDSDRKSIDFVVYQKEPLTDDQSTTRDTRHLLAALLVVFATVGLAGLFVLSRRNAALNVDDEPDTSETEPAAEAIGQIAGDAADRIEDETADANPVYRAWREMTAVLDAENPEATTAGEFAELAVAAGLDADDVAELTRLFEDVRYGDRDPDAYADRALDTLRRVERAYAGDGHGAEPRTDTEPGPGAGPGNNGRGDE